MTGRANASTESEEQPPATTSRVQPGVMASIGSLVAPLTVMFTGMLYLAGWTYTGTVAAEFGLDSSAFQEPIQATLARGYIPLLCGVITVSGVYAFPYMIHQRVLNYRKHRNPDAKRADVQKSESTLKRFRFAATVMAMMLTLLVGLLGGTVLGELKADGIRVEVYRGCKDRCFLYSVGEKKYLGMIIAQDQNRTAVYTKDGLVMTRTDDISAVRKGLRTSPLPLSKMRPPHPERALSK